ncbi:hypothetical protein AB4525_08145 [Vibrio breoganii]
MSDEKKYWIINFVMKSGATTQVRTDDWYAARDTAGGFHGYLKDPKSNKSYYDNLPNPQTETGTRWVVDYTKVEMIEVEEAT